MDPYAELQEKMRRKDELLREREDKVQSHQRSFIFITGLVLCKNYH